MTIVNAGLDVLSVVGNIDAELIAAADKTEQAKKPGLRRLLSAACIGLALLAAFFAWHFLKIGAGIKPARRLEIPPFERSAEAQPKGMLAPLFFYNGHCYIEALRLPKDTQLVGEHVCTVIAGISERLPIEYKELCGTVSGRIFAVKGYDESYMLCLRRYDGTIGVYVNSHGLAIEGCADIFEARLNLSKRFSELLYETEASMYAASSLRYDHERELWRLKPANNKAVRRFIAALDDAEPMSAQENMSKVADREKLLFMLHLMLDDGMRVEIRVFSGGYVFTENFYSVMIKMDEAALAEFITVLESEKNREPTQKIYGIPYCSIEECRAEPRLGGYVPSYTPEGFKAGEGTVIYAINEQTGAVGAAESIKYYIANDEYDLMSVTIADSNRLARRQLADGLIVHQYNGESCIVYDKKKLSLRRIRINLENGYGSIGVLVDDAVVLVSVHGNIQAKDIYELLSSVANR